MFVLPDHESCGQFIDAGDILCIGGREVRITKKWGLAVKLDAPHFAKTGSPFEVGKCHGLLLSRSITMPLTLSANSTSHAFAVDDIGQRVVLFIGGSAGVHELGFDREYLLRGFETFLVNPVGLIINSYDGRMIVCDTGNNRIVTLPSPASKSRYVMSTIAGGIGAKRFSSLSSPVSVSAIFRSDFGRPYDALFTADLGNNRVMRWRPFAKRGELLDIKGLNKPTQVLLLDKFRLLVVDQGESGNSGRVLLVRGRKSALSPDWDLKSYPDVLWSEDMDPLETGSPIETGNIYISVKTHRLSTIPGATDLSVTTISNTLIMSSRRMRKTWRCPIVGCDKGGDFQVLFNDEGYGSIQAYTDKDYGNGFMGVSSDRLVEFRPIKV